MSSDDEECLLCNEYLILNENEDNNSILIKIDYRPFIRNVEQWNYNRTLNTEKVDELYESIKDNSTIDWNFTAAKEKGKDNLILLDGQHRSAAIKKYLDEDINMKCKKYVIITVYYIDDRVKDHAYLCNIFTKINNNVPFDPLDLPSIKVSNIISLIKSDSILCNGISTNTKTQNAHPPIIHEKRFNMVLSNNRKYIDDLTPEQIIIIMKEFNNKLSLMKATDIYGIQKVNEKAYNKAKNINFYIGLNTNKFSFEKFIINIKNLYKLFE